MPMFASQKCRHYMRKITRPEALPAASAHMCQSRRGQASLIFRRVQSVPAIVWEIGRLGGPVCKQPANLWNGSWNASSLHVLLKRLCLRSPNSCSKLSNSVSGTAANQLALATAQFEPDHLV
jgi:hypothetical protein